MRSFLFVPGDSNKKIHNALQSNADALILDWEDSVAATNKDSARQITSDILKQHASNAIKSGREPEIFIRINPSDTPWHNQDIEIAARLPIKGLVLPKTNSAKDITALDAALNNIEAENTFNQQKVDIFAIVTEKPQSIFNLGSYSDVSDRLKWMAWGAEDLAAELGASENRHCDNSYRSPYKLVRDLCLLGARAAGVEPIDTVFVDIHDGPGFKLECQEAHIDGFTGKMLIHPSQIDDANRVFTPTKSQIDRAQKIVDHFTNNPTSGVVMIDGKMIDQPHMKMAQSLLKRAVKNITPDLDD